MRKNLEHFLASLVFAAFLPIAALGYLFVFLVIGWHELGHLFFGKLFKVGVEEYVIGIGPTLFEFTWRDTKYRLKLFPIGGYIHAVDWVDSQDENLVHEPRWVQKMVKDRKVWFSSQPIWEQIIIDIGGVFFNFVMAAVILYTIGLAIPVDNPIETVIRSIWDHDARMLVVGIRPSADARLFDYFSNFDKVIDAGWPTILRAFSVVSIGIGALNILPILPLDGGAIFRDLIAAFMLHGKRGKEMIRVRKMIQHVAFGLSVAGFIAVIWVQTR